MSLGNYIRLSLVGLALWILFIVAVGEQRWLSFLTYLSSDGYITNPVLTTIKLTLALAFCGILLPIFWLTWRPRNVIGGWQAATKLERTEIATIGILLLAFVAAIAVWGKYLNLDQPGWLGKGTLHGEDGPLEDLTAVCAIAASVLLIIVNVKRYTGSSSAIIYTIAFAAFLFGMEEVSWGQRIFGIASPEVFATRNVQEELNLHNFLSPRTIHLHFPVIVNLTLAVYFFFAPKLAKWFPEELRSSIAPQHHLLLSLVFQLLTIQSIGYFSAEVTEEVLSVMLLFFGLKLRHPSTPKSHADLC